MSPRRTLSSLRFSVRKMTFAVGAGIVSQLAVLASNVFNVGDSGRGLTDWCTRNRFWTWSQFIGARIAGRDMAKLLKVCGYAGLVFAVCYVGAASKSVHRNGRSVYCSRPSQRWCTVDAVNAGITDGSTRSCAWTRDGWRHGAGEHNDWHSPASLPGSRLSSSEYVQQSSSLLQLQHVASVVYLFATAGIIRRLRN